MVEALKVKAVDATAAGDTFCGAVCVALSEGKTLEEAARYATKASALTVQKMGAQSSIPYITDIK
jgi:ribokinase